MSFPRHSYRPSKFWRMIVETVINSIAEAGGGEGRVDGAFPLDKVRSISALWLINIVNSSLTSIFVGT